MTLYKRFFSESDKDKIVGRAMELRKAHKLSTKVIAERLQLTDRSHLRKILMERGQWEEFYGSLIR